MSSSTDTPATASCDFQRVRDDFVRSWGALGTSWGINRTMAMIHALLLISPEPVCTDDVMEALQISRGNANTNLRELVSWGLVHPEVIPGQRKDYFVAEKDVWKIFCIVTRERKRRETEPALRVLADCADRSEQFDTPEGREFHRQINELAKFVELTNGIMERVARSEQNQILPRILPLLKWGEGK
ncbi:MAG: transcriptional regulator [Verrucomicrobiota bacterium JB022]|nr:transcriptional regulator [Verrucomicrobiota bacterium JB022]